MKLFFQYCSFGFSNSYILSAENTDTDKTNPAIIVDPGNMEKDFLNTIEKNDFDINIILITHDHHSHVRGLRTLKRIYNAEIYAVNQTIQDHKTNMVRDGDKINRAGFTIEVISIPGHSSDSVVYRIDHLLFTGDVLTAGLAGSTASAYGAATQMNKLRSRLLSLPGDYVILPGHGPPSTMEAERRFNMDIFNFDQKRTKRTGFLSDIF